jgi:hypothetical protein
VLLDPQENGYGKVTARNGNIETIEGMVMGILMPTNPASGLNGFRILPFQQAWYWGKWQESPLLHEGEKLKSLIDIAVYNLPDLGGGAAYQPLNLSLHPLSRGEEAYAIGYALMQDIPIEYVEGQPLISKFDWELYVSTGKVIDVFPLNHVNRDVPTPGPALIFRPVSQGK